MKTDKFYFHCILFLTYYDLSKKLFPALLRCKLFHQVQYDQGQFPAGSTFLLICSNIIDG